MAYHDHPCVGCGVALVPQKWPGPLPPGHKRHISRGRCSTCYEDDRRPAPKPTPPRQEPTVTTPALDLDAAVEAAVAAEYTRYRARLSRPLPPDYQDAPAGLIRLMREEVRPLIAAAAPALAAQGWDQGYQARTMRAYGLTGPARNPHLPEAPK